MTIEQQRYSPGDMKAFVDENFKVQCKCRDQVRIPLLIRFS